MAFLSTGAYSPNYSMPVAGVHSAQVVHPTHTGMLLFIQFILLACLFFCLAVCASPVVWGWGTDATDIEFMADGVLQLHYCTAVNFL